jgi:hypothetical protein
MYYELYSRNFRHEKAVQSRIRNLMLYTAYVWYTSKLNMSNLVLVRRGDRRWYITITFQLDYRTFYTYISCTILLTTVVSMLTKPIATSALVSVNSNISFCWDFNNTAHHYIASIGNVSTVKCALPLHAFRQSNQCLLKELASKLLDCELFVIYNIFCAPYTIDTFCG